jgi:hypothetical protein
MEKVYDGLAAIVSRRREKRQNHDRQNRIVLASAHRFNACCRPKIANFRRLSRIEPANNATLSCSGVSSAFCIKLANDAKASISRPYPAVKTRRCARKCPRSGRQHLEHA